MDRPKPSEKLEAVVQAEYLVTPGAPTGSHIESESVVDQKEGQTKLPHLDDHTIDCFEKLPPSAVYNS